MDDSYGGSSRPPVLRFGVFELSVKTGELRKAGVLGPLLERGTPQARMRRVGLMTVLVAACSIVLSAQETTGTITGTATDQTGAVLPGVTVTVKNIDNGFERAVVTNNEGIYTATLLPIGSYDLVFELARFQPATMRGVTLHVNDRLQIDGRLTVGGGKESVIVTASSEFVQPIAALQTTMAPRQVQELPLNNRNFVQLATLAPGVSSDLPDEVGVGTTSTVSLSINGARRNAVNWLVDGVSDVDVGSNISLLSTPSLDSIQEFKIITNGYHAEWPRSGGGIVNVVTKSGSNQFSGSAYEFLRNDTLNANSFFRNLSPDPALHSGPPPITYNNFGATAGGPIQRSKLFFFFSEELRRITRVSVSTTAFTYDPAWLTDPSSPNYVAPALRDANAVKLLSAWPLPNTFVDHQSRYLTSEHNINNTRQEVVRVDDDLTSNWRLTGRYTHDTNFTEDPGGVFLNLLVPNVGTTDTTVLSQVAAVVLRGVMGQTKLNELQFQFSGNAVADTNPPGTRAKAADYGISIPSIYGGNTAGYIPSVGVSAPMSPIGANQLYRIAYRNYVVTNNFSWQHGTHAMKFGGLTTFEQKDENAANQTQGSFSFVAGGGRTAFQNFLTGNTDGLCGNPCTYKEAQTDITVHLRFNRYEMYAQDTWKPRGNLTFDYGIRYALYPAVTDANNVLTNFVPSAYNPANAPMCADVTCSAILVGTGDPLNGIIVAGRNSPFGNAVSSFDKTNIQPRVGVTYDPTSTTRTIFRGSYGVYHDQALAGIFEDNAFTNPPFVNNVNILNARLSNPGAGSTATSGVLNLIGTGADFNTPRTQQWSVGVQRQLYARGALDVSYVGAHGDHLIRPIDINYPQPQDVLRLDSVNLARPYRGYGSITMRTTTARSNYWGLLTSFRHDAGRAGLLTVNYTFSRNRTDASNDRDGNDVPQNPLNLAAEYADARTDRRHIFTANYVHMLPFFKDSSHTALKAALAGWQIAGLTTLNSGQPVPRIVVNTHGFLRGNRANRVGDPGVGRQTGLFWFDPNAYLPPADGTFGNSGRDEFRQPGRNQTDLSVSKNWFFNGNRRLQFRADMINAFNHTQWLGDPMSGGVANACTFDLTTCNVSPFGQIFVTRNPREIQLGLKLSW